MKKAWMVIFLLITASLFALDDFSVPHTWSPGDTIRDSDFEANNDTIEAWAARTNDSLDAKFLRTSAMDDSTWPKITVDTLIADSIKSRVLAITTYSPDSMFARTIKTSGTVTFDSIHTSKAIKASRGRFGATYLTDSLYLYRTDSICVLQNPGGTIILFSFDVITGNVTFGGYSPTRNRTGDKIFSILNTNSAPADTAIAGGYLYSEFGALKWKGPNGTVTTIANP